MYITQTYVRCIMRVNSKSCSSSLKRGKSARPISASSSFYQGLLLCAEYVYVRDPLRRISIKLGSRNGSFGQPYRFVETAVACVSISFLVHAYHLSCYAREKKGEREKEKPAALIDDRSRFEREIFLPPAKKNAVSAFQFITLARKVDRHARVAIDNANFTSVT